MMYPKASAVERNGSCKAVLSAMQRTDGQSPWSTRSPGVLAGVQRVMLPPRQMSLTNLTFACHPSHPPVPGPGHPNSRFPNITIIITTTPIFPITPIPRLSPPLNPVHNPVTLISTTITWIGKSKNPGLAPPLMLHRAALHPASNGLSPEPPFFPQPPPRRHRSIPRRLPALRLNPPDDVRLVRHRPLNNTSRPYPSAPPRPRPLLLTLRSPLLSTLCRLPITVTPLMGMDIR